MLVLILVLFHPYKYQKNANRENSQCYILKYYRNADNWNIILPNACKTRFALLNSSFISVYLCIIVFVYCIFDFDF